MFQTNKKQAQVAVVLAIAMLTLGANAAVDTAISTAISDAITTILAIVALGGAGFITVKLAVVGWNVGAKFIGRLGGKA